MKRYTTIFARVKRLTLSPAQEWKIISEEKRSVSEIFFSFLLPFSLVTVVASYIGYGIVGSKQDMFGLIASEKLGFRYATYYSILILSTIFISSLVISMIATFFQANNSYSRNFKLVVYSFTPSMAATVLLIIPALAPLVLITGVYNLLLLYVGLNRITNVLKEKKWGYYFSIIGTLVFVFFSLSKILYRIILD